LHIFPTYGDEIRFKLREGMCYSGMGLTRNGIGFNKYMELFSQMGKFSTFFPAFFFLKDTRETQILKSSKKFETSCF
jgi:hypothetical protein